MPYPAIAVANEFLARAFLDHGTLSPMQLQKLCYFAHGWHLALTDGTPLIEEPAQAWSWGPVFPSLYQAVKDWGGEPLDRLITRPSWAFRRASAPGEVEIPGIPPRDSYVSGLLDRVWETYGHLSSARLSQLTHDPDGPWFKLRQESQSRRGVTIPDDQILAHFTEQMTANAAR